jgi:hypothetical protein
MGEASVTRKILELLRIRHQASEWATFVELRSKTGVGDIRFLDFFAMSLWKSKGFQRISYEIKVSRADFAREINQPQKRAFAESVSTECYFAMPSGLARVDEIPEGWGLIELTTGGLRRKKQAMQREPADLPYSFVTSLARRLSDPAPDLPAAVWVYAGREVEIDELLKMVDDNLSAVKADWRYQNIQEFEKSDSYKRLATLSSVVRHNLGFKYQNPDELADWFKENVDGTVMEMGWRVRKQLKSLRTQIDELLKEDDDE